jgi:hypothetical protein
MDKLTEIRERHGRQHPRLFSGRVDEKQSEIRERYLSNGALGAGSGLAIGAGFGVAVGNLAWGIGLGICIGTGLGIALGSSLGNKHAKAAQEPDTDGSGDA